MDSRGLVRPPPRGSNCSIVPSHARKNVSAFAHPISYTVVVYVATTVGKPVGFISLFSHSLKRLVDRIKFIYVERKMQNFWREMKTWKNVKYTYILFTFSYMHDTICTFSCTRDNLFDTEHPLNVKICRFSCWHYFHSRARSKSACGILYLYILFGLILSGKAAKFKKISKSNQRWKGGSEDPGI